MSEFTPGWTSQLGDPPPAPSPISSQTPAAYELRPLSTGEILDRTFTLYRRNFWLYTGLAAVATGITAISNIARFAIAGAPTVVASNAGTSPFGPGGARATLISSTISLVAALVFLAAYSVTTAATTSAVSSVYLGRETSALLALKRIGGSWFRYILISLWQGCSLMWVPFILFVAGFVLLARAVAPLAVLLFVLATFSVIYGIIAYIRNSLAIPASVVENLKVRKTMKRSKHLAAGDKGRIFLLFLFLWVLSLVAGAIQIPIAVFLVRSHAGQRVIAEGLTIIVNFLTSTVIGPVGAIGLCLFYFDERVRKEGFDIEALMERSLGGAAVETPAVPVIDSPFTSQLPGASTHSDTV